MLGPKMPPLHKQQLYLDTHGLLLHKRNLGATLETGSVHDRVFPAVMGQVE
jgi:hypothetical protein